MKAPANKAALLALQWTLGVVIFIEAALLAFSKTEVRFSGQPAIHHWIRVMLGWSEMLACVLFLVPRATRFGAWLLIVVLAAAALVHMLRGNFQIGGLLIYAAAVAVVAISTHSETSGQQS